MGGEKVAQNEDVSDDELPEWIRNDGWIYLIIVGAIILLIAVICIINCRRNKQSQAPKKARKLEANEGQKGRASSTVAQSAPGDSKSSSSES